MILRPGRSDDVALVKTLPRLSASPDQSGAPRGLCVQQDPARSPLGSATCPATCPHTEHTSLRVSASWSSRFKALHDGPRPAPCSNPAASPTCPSCSLPFAGAPASFFPVPGNRRVFTLAQDLRPRCRQGSRARSRCRGEKLRSVTDASRTPSRRSIVVVRLTYFSILKKKKQKTLCEDVPFMRNFVYNI